MNSPHKPAFTLIELPAMRNLRPCSGRAGFTLIELLVVITIIVVLLALLVPALDKAIYQAELAVCGARLKTVAQAAIQYAASAKRTYPYRSVIKQNAGQPSRLVAAWPAGFFDDRFMFKGYMTTQAMLCPLSAGFDVDSTNPAASDNVFSGYSLWFQFRYTDTPYKAMDRIGQRFTWKPVADDTRLYEFALLASDLDHVRRDVGSTWVGHPDKDGLMSELVLLGTGYVVGGLTGRQYSSWWQSDNAVRRGEVDLNYAYEDGSIRRIDNVYWNEWEDRDRMVRVPEHSGLTAEQPDWHQLPRP